MKKILGLIVTMALLMATSTAWAQSGKINGEGLTFNYSLSGGNVIKHGQTKGGPKQLYYTCEATAGETVTLTCSVDCRKKDKNPHCYLRIEARESASVSSRTIFSKTLDGKSVTYSYTIPKDAKYVTMKGDVQDGTRTPCYVSVSWTVVDKATKPERPTYKYEKIERPPMGKCHQKDSKIRFNDWYGEVKIRCNFEEDDSYEFVDYETVIYEDDRIKTEEESGAILGLEDMSTYVVKPETTLIIHTEEDKTTKLEMLMGSMWSNIKKIAAGKSLEIEMSQCVCGINGTIFGVEERGGVSKVWLFAGKVTITSKRTRKKQVLNPGETSSVSRNGEIVVNNFNIEQMAKKFGIKMSDIQNHHSNTGNNGLVFTVDKLHYKILSNSTVEVTGDLRGTYKGRVSIPTQVKHNGTTYRVVGIGQNAFANQTGMTAVDIPSSVVSIKQDAFNNTGLKDVTIPGNNVKIAKWAFHNCKKLVTATVRGKTPSCNPETFVGCSSMRELHIRDIKPTNYGKRLTGTNAIIKKLE